MLTPPPDNVAWVLTPLPPPSRFGDVEEEEDGVLALVADPANDRMVMVMVREDKRANKQVKGFCPCGRDSACMRGRRS